MRSPGWILTMLAPFLLIFLVFGASLFTLSAPQSNAIAISVTPTSEEALLVERLRNSFSPEHFSKSGTPETLHWTPVAATHAIGSVIEGDGSSLYVKARAEIDLQSGSVRFYAENIETTDVMGPIVSAPAGHNVRSLFDPIRTAIYQHKISQQQGSEFSVFQIDSSPEDKSAKTKATAFLFISIILASAIGTLGARSANELSTAYLGDNHSNSDLNFSYKEDFFGKLLGIGFAHFLVFLPWLILFLGAIVLFAVTGLLVDPVLPNTLLSALFNPLRILVFLASISSAYLVIGSLILAVASRMSESASARSLAGPGSFVALIPFTITMIFAFDPTSQFFKFLTYFPLTSPCALQIGVNSMAPREIAGSLITMTSTSGAIVFIIFTWLLKPEKNFVKKA